MREIKFRVWNNNSMEYFELDNEFDCITGWIGPNPLMQYTGVKDKNGKEIYDGDIITDECDTKYLIVFNDGCFYGQYDENDAEGDIDIANKFSPINVIGNIHENPELC